MTHWVGGHARDLGSAERAVRDDAGLNCYGTLADLPGSLVILVDAIMVSAFH